MINRNTDELYDDDTLEFIWRIYFFNDKCILRSYTLINLFNETLGDFKKKGDMASRLVSKFLSRNDVIYFGKIVNNLKKDEKRWHL
jgi:hypothetical protein